MDAPVISVVTATYNRAKLLHRVFDSLMEQTERRFEWVIVDDGSTDNTEHVVHDFQQLSFFAIKYIKTTNQGKASALNTSMEYCDGVLYLVIDSDDWCDPHALETFYKEYKGLTTLGIGTDEYFAISCLKRFSDGRIVGDDYSRMRKYGDTYIDRLNKGVKGDKWECLILDKIKGHSYPVIDGEKYMAPGYLWVQIADLGFKTVFVNESLSVVEYQQDGISQNNIKHRLASVNNTVRYYQDSYKLRSASMLVAGRYYSNYVRFSCHANSAPVFSVRFCLFYLVGVGLYLKDCIKK